MHKFKFAEDDVIVNRLKTYPEYNIFIYQSIQYTNRDQVTGSGEGGLYVYDIERSPHPSWTQPSARFGRPRIVSSPGYRQDFKANLTNPLVDSWSQNLAYASDNSWDPDQQAGLFRFKEYTAARVGGYCSDPIYSNQASCEAAGETWQLVPTGLTSSYARVVPVVRRLTRKMIDKSFDAFDLTTGQLAPFTVPHGLNPTASALTNLARKYVCHSPHFIFEGRNSLTASTFKEDVRPSSIPARNLLHEDINFIFIPQFYCGSGIKRGSVNLKYFLTGSQVAQCSDVNQNGELIEVTGTVVSGNRVTGSVVGLVLYDEGIIMLTASHNLETGPSLGIHYKQDSNAGNSSAVTSSWLHFGTTLNDTTASTGTNLNKASYELNFKGTSYVTSMTMFAHAEKGHLNHSNNPTYRDYGETLNAQTGSGNIFYQGSTAIKNIVTSSHTSASFEKITYISKINIYDENNNLIAITSLAKPVKKTEDVNYTFKLKLDI